VGQGELFRATRPVPIRSAFGTISHNHTSTLDAGPYKITTRNVDGRPPLVYELKP